MWCHFFWKIESESFGFYSFARCINMTVFLGSDVKVARYEFIGECNIGLFVFFKPLAEIQLFCQYPKFRYLSSTHFGDDCKSLGHKFSINDSVKKDVGVPRWPIIAIQILNSFFDSQWSHLVQNFETGVISDHVFNDVFKHVSSGVIFCVLLNFLRHT